jgi:hypothetical protein
VLPIITAATALHLRIAAEWHIHIQRGCYKQHTARDMGQGMGQEFRIDAETKLAALSIWRAQA